MDLIVGADGVLGSRLLKFLTRLGRETAGTSRRSDAGPGMLRVDLSKEPGSWQLPQRVDTAYLLAGVTKMAACRRDPAGTSHINVDAMAELTRLLASRGAFLIYPSTSQVFDGSIPRVPADRPTSPVSEYGRQKAAMEGVVLGEFQNAAAVTRLTKVLSPGDLVAGWAKALLAGEPIEPFHDMSFCPVPLSGAISVMALVGSLREPGVWQVSGEQDISYAQAALWGAEALGAPSSLVRPVSYVEKGIRQEGAGPYTSFDCSGLQERFGLCPPLVRDTVNLHFRKQ